jgi:hypothetical protein
MYDHPPEEFLNSSSETPDLSVSTAISGGQLIRTGT